MQVGRQVLATVLALILAPTYVQILFVWIVSKVSAVADCLAKQAMCEAFQMELYLLSIYYVCNKRPTGLAVLFPLRSPWPFTGLPNGYGQEVKPLVKKRAVERRGAEPFCCDNI